MTDSNFLKEVRAPECADGCIYEGRQGGGCPDNRCDLKRPVQGNEPFTEREQRGNLNAGHEIGRGPERPFLGEDEEDRDAALEP